MLSLVDLVAHAAEPPGRITGEKQQLMQRNWASALENALVDTPGLRAANGEWIVAEVLRHLPASLPTSKLAQPRRVPWDDLRVALRGQWGLYACGPTPACHFLGMCVIG